MPTARQPNLADRTFLTERLRGFGATIFGEMSSLAARTGAINLGQGFPDTDGPAVVREAAIEAMRAGHNQYPPPLGILELRQAIAEHQRRFYDLAFDPETEVLVTAGATEAIAATILALCDHGDEVVSFEPYYDSYSACIAMAGAQRVPVTLRAPDFALDVDALRAAITPRTRLLLLNTPHNPTGKVFTREELAAVAQVCIEHDLVVMTDEVYEHLVYADPQRAVEHVPLASMPGMRDRTITVSSAGKTFSFTGWKVGWVCGAPDLVAAVRTVKQFLTYVNAAPFQHAVAVALSLTDEFYDGFVSDMRIKRDLLVAGLQAAGFGVFVPDGTYFVTTDIRPLGYADGMAFCRALPERAGVVAIPAVVLYDNVNEGSPLVRFAFCKRTEVLEDAIERLSKLAVDS